MSINLFIDIDTQNDFMNPDGALYVSGAETIKPNLSKIYNWAKENNSYIIASVDAHEPDDIEFNYFKPHCVKKTYGQQKIVETKLDNPLVISMDYPKKPELKKKHFIIEKNDFNVFVNPHTAKLLELINPDNIYIFGVATDYCVKAATESILKRYKNVSIIVDATKGIDNNKSNEFLNFVKSSGVQLIKTEQLTKGLLCVSH